MSVSISEAVKWTEKMEYGKFELIDRIFLINASRENCGLKVSVNFRRTEKNWPEMEMKAIEGAETLNDPVRITLRFDTSDGSGALTFDSTVGFNVESLKSGYLWNILLIKGSNSNYGNQRAREGVESFRKTHAMIKSESVNYTMEFNLNLKKLVATPKPKKIHEKLYLDQETSDVKIDCKGKIFPCHRIVLRYKFQTQYLLKYQTTVQKILITYLVHI